MHSTATRGKAAGSALALKRVDACKAARLGARNACSHIRLSSQMRVPENLGYSINLEALRF
jgi:hypothetical protein